MNSRKLRVRPAPDQATGVLPLGSTSALLTEGGDRRILLCGPDGTNQYDCGPFPDPELLAFGSSTASTISEDGFASADRLRNRLLDGDGLDGAPETYARELERVRRSLLELWTLDDLPGLGVIFGPSGTDLHLIATHLLAESGAAPLCVLMIQGEETGSGVPMALARRHLSDRSPLGDVLDGGALLPGCQGLEVLSVPVREDDGSPRAAKDIDADFEDLTEQALADGKRVLLVAVDISKTGILAPSTDCMLALKRRQCGRLEVLVDACQFRIGQATLRAYLERDCLVALTGSKFLTGPAFCGALLVPPAIARRLRHASLAALRSYSARAEWPQDWPKAAVLRRTANFGLLLRWEAALAEVLAFASVSNVAAIRFLDAFAASISRRLRELPAFEALPVPAIERNGLGLAGGWDLLPTIFPFLLRRPAKLGTGGVLTRLETQQVYRLLRQGRGFGLPASCQLGQPVLCGTRGGIPVSALRLCVSARLIAEATANGGAASEKVIARAMTALDYVAMLVWTRLDSAENGGVL